MVYERCHQRVTFELDDPVQADYVGFRANLNCQCHAKGAALENQGHSDLSWSANSSIEPGTIVQTCTLEINGDFASSLNGNNIKPSIHNWFIFPSPFVFYDPFKLRCFCRVYQQGQRGAQTGHQLQRPALSACGRHQLTSLGNRCT